ncbi:MAG: DUF2007 domain-containing protein [Syntrophobacteraceae bacterium]
MQKVYSSPDRATVYRIKSTLEDNGIEITVLGEDRGVAVGGIAPLDAWLELWLFDEERLEEARQIVEDVLKDIQIPQEKWKCPNCGEELEGQFSQCWKCGTERL